MIAVKYIYSIDELEVMQANPWLTDRERQVFDMFYRRGRKIEWIAAELDLSRRTVINDLQKIRSKTSTQKPAL